MTEVEKYRQRQEVTSLCNNWDYLVLLKEMQTDRTTLKISLKIIVKFNNHLTYDQEILLPSILA